MKIYNKEFDEKELIEKIKKGKYNSIPEAKVKEEIKKFLRNHFSFVDKLDKKKYSDKVIKGVKRELYKGIGVFSEGESLEEHHSTKDRDYSIYGKIEAKKIVDLGAGLNPLAYDKLKGKPEYVAYEINEDNVKTVNEFFKKNKINGKAYCKDVLKIKKFPKADVYFLFKFLDSIEKSGHKLAEELMKKIPAKLIVVSFSTKTLSGKPMNYPYRGWFERMCFRLKWDFNKYKTEDEIFYMVRK